MSVAAAKGTVDADAIAAEVLAAIDGRRQIRPFTSRPGGLTQDDAYRITALLAASRVARGEKVIGRKIGFTNRDMWAKYGIDAPNWAYVTDRTLYDLAPVSLADFVEPKIEPEIVFGIGRAPSADMDEAGLMDCVDWVAFGFEIVQSIFPGWKFALADTTAASALHGALVVGPRHHFRPRAAEWRRELASFAVELYRNGELAECGSGANVLDSPLLALQHLVRVLAKDPINPQLQPGEIVSTGTLTLAQPIATGDIWRAKLNGIALDGLELRFT